MELIPQSVEILDPRNKREWISVMKKIERAYRICYASEGKATEDSYQTFIPKHISHGSPLEHGTITVELQCSRAIQQELTRHRLASFSIESTRWIDYFRKNGGKADCIFVTPADWDSFTEVQRDLYRNAMQSSEDWYNRLRESGLLAQRARDAFSLGLKGSIVMTANVREWRHIFRERATNKAAHPDIRQLTQMILMRVADEAQPLFGDLLETDEEIG
jgi:thymidylate synthase (FAD)